MDEEAQQPDGQPTPPQGPEVTTAMTPATWVMDLYLRPARFFRRPDLPQAWLGTLLIAWLVGISGAMDRLDMMDARGRIDASVGFMYGWVGRWSMAILGGIAAAFMLYVVGGWWYRLRLRWSGEVEVDREVAWRLLLFSTAAHALPWLIYKIWQTFVYASPARAVVGDDWGSAHIYLVLPWSALISYRGVRACFDVRAGSARLWFLILPIVTYSAGMLAPFLLAWSGGLGTLEPRPDVNHPEHFEDVQIRFEYPGNWVIEPVEEGPGPRTYLSIRPVLADAGVQIALYEPLVSSEEAARQMRDRIGVAFDLRDESEIDRWGMHAGFGYTYAGSIDGAEYIVLLFCAADQEPAFEVLEIVELAAAQRLGAGFELIRQTFARTE